MTDKRFFIVECKSPAGPMKAIVEGVDTLIDMGNEYDFRVIAEITEDHAKKLRSEWQQ
jgi:hypothetical protein